MTRTLTLSWALACFLACSGEPQRHSTPPPPYYNFFKEYELIPESATVATSQVPLETVGSEVCGGDEGIVLCAHGDWKAFTLEFRNETRSPMAVHWDRARYVDENGTEHPVRPRGEGMESFKADGVAPGTRIRRTVDAAGKRGVRGTGEYAYVGYEPLIPWTHDQNPEATRGTIQALFANGVPVLLRIPISVGDEETLAVWTFRLKAQRFQVP